MRYSMFFIFILLLSNIGFSWDYTTHSSFISQVCEDLQCNCQKEMITGLKNERIFDERYNYNPLLCEDSEFYDCPKEVDDSAIKKYEEWLYRAKLEEGCDIWYSIGAASWFWVESKEIWNRVVNYSQSCRENYEFKVSSFMKEDTEGWIVVECEQTIASFEFINWKNHFEKELYFLANSTTIGEHPTEPLFGVIPIPEIDFMWVLIIACVVFLVLVWWKG